MGQEYHARLGTAVAAGDVDRRILGELLKQRNHAELWERPGVGCADQHFHTRILELLGHKVGLRLAVTVLDGRLASGESGGCSLSAGVLARNANDET